MADVLNASPPSDARLIRRATFFLPIAALLLFAASLSFDFTGWDDAAYIQQNAHMTAADGLARIWTTGESEQYYPLTFTSYWLEYQLWGERPLGYHATNVVLHALTVTLLILVLRALRLSDWVVFVVAALFAVHPVQVMTVAWVAERKNLLSTCFVLLTMLCWIRHGATGRTRNYVAAILFFAVALLSKTAILVLPLVLLALDVVVLRRQWRGSLVRIVPLLILSISAWAVTATFEEKFVTNIPPLEVRPFIAAAAVGYYAFLLIAPVRLLPIYPRWDVSPGDFFWWLPLAGLIVAAVLWIFFRRRIPSLAHYGIVHFLAFLLPVLGLIAYGNMAVTFVSDHYLYLASIGAFVILAVLLDKWRSRQGARFVISGVVFVALALYAAKTFIYMSVFKNADAMWSYTLSGNPQCYPAYAGLGREAERKPDWPEAVRRYRQAYDVMPDLPDAQYDLGRSLYKAGEYTQAEQILLKMHAAYPGFTPVVLYLAEVAKATGRLDLAIERFEQASTLAPNDAEPYYQLAEIYRGKGDLASSADWARAAITRNPSHAWAYWTLGECERRTGKYHVALENFERGLVASRNDAYLLASQAFLLSTCPDNAIRDGTHAVILARKAVDVSKGELWEPLDALAAALAETGQFEEAVATEQRAALIAEMLHDTKASQTAKQRVELYRAHRPLRDPQ